MKARLTFFLGGHDLEMLAIRELLEAEAAGRFHDKALRWGARASAYRDEIEACLRRGETPVLVELDDDLGLDALVVVDHHGERAGEDEATSLEQVFALLELPRERWTRWHELVAANDRAYVPGLVAAGATREEIARVRAADRAAQGITPEDEAEAERAIARASRLCDGRLTVVRAAHARLAAVEDRLRPELGGPGALNLLLIAPDEVDFAGDGRVVTALARRFPGGWYGGALPARGFWGHAGELPGVVNFVAEEVGAVGATGSQAGKAGHTPQVDRA
jgi:hypothetical protein